MTINMRFLKILAALRSPRAPEPIPLHWSATSPGSSPPTVLPRIRRRSGRGRSAPAALRRKRVALRGRSVPPRDPVEGRLLRGRGLRRPGARRSDEDARRVARCVAERNRGSAGRGAPGWSPEGAHRPAGEDLRREGPRPRRDGRPPPGRLRVPQEGAPAAERAGGAGIRGHRGMLSTLDPHSVLLPPRSTTR